MAKAAAAEVKPVTFKSGSLSLYRYSYIGLSVHIHMTSMTPSPLLRALWIPSSLLIRLEQVCSVQLRVGGFHRCCYHSAMTWILQHRHNISEDMSHIIQLWLVLCVSPNPKGAGLIPDLSQCLSQGHWLENQPNIQKMVEATGVTRDELHKEMPCRCRIRTQDLLDTVGLTSAPLCCTKTKKNMVCFAVAR